MLGSELLCAFRMLLKQRELISKLAHSRVPNCCIDQGKRVTNLLECRDFGVCATQSFWDVEKP